MKTTKTELPESVETYRERKNLWVAYLRSGKYPQTDGRLRWETAPGAHSYCCLGVACELHRGLTGTGSWNEEDDLTYEVSKFLDDMELPRPVADWLGMSQRDGITHLVIDSEKHHRVSLVSLNDDTSWNFNKIADFIDSEPPGLFMWNLEGGVGDSGEHPLWEEARNAKNLKLEVEEEG